MPRTRNIDNGFIANVLEQVAVQLESQWAPARRIEAYRKAAQAVRDHKQSVRTLTRKGDRLHAARLLQLGISEIASIEEIAHTGHLRLLDRLEGRTAAADLFSQVSGVTKRLAVRLHAELGIDTLEELEVAAHDGRLAEFTGYAPRRLKQIQNGVARLLSCSARRDSRCFQELLQAGATVVQPPLATEPPAIGMLLRVDLEYREKARQNLLSRVRPSGHNPHGLRSLPVFHTEIDNWQFTALFETSEMQDVGEERVIIVYERDGFEGQRTVMTDGGSGRVRRVVEGMEAECAEFDRKRLAVRPLRGSRSFRPN
jgi:hypothetical protein